MAVFTGWMRFLSSNQQRQGTKGPNTQHKL